MILHAAGSGIRCGPQERFRIDKPDVHKGAPAAQCALDGEHNAPSLPQHAADHDSSQCPSGA